MRGLDVDQLAEQARELRRVPGQRAPASGGSSPRADEVARWRRGSRAGRRRRRSPTVEQLCRPSRWSTIVRLVVVRSRARRAGRARRRTGARRSRRAADVRLAASGSCGFSPRRARPAARASRPSSVAAALQRLETAASVVASFSGCTACSSGQQVVEHLLQPMRRRCGPARSRRRRRAAAASRLRRDQARTARRTASSAATARSRSPGSGRPARVERHRQVAPVAVVLDRRRPADDQPAHLHVGVRVELVADPVDLQRHLDVRRERTCCTSRRRTPTSTAAPARTTSDMRRIGAVSRHPATLTVVSCPRWRAEEEVDDATVTIDGRTARPPRRPHRRGRRWRGSRSSSGSG